MLSITEAIDFLRSNIALVGFIASAFFFSGILLGTNVIGPASDVNELKSDVRGAVCLINASVEGTTPSICEVFFSNETREFLRILRGGHIHQQQFSAEIRQGLYFLPSNTTYDRNRPWLFN